MELWEGLFKEQSGATAYLNQFPQTEDTFNTNPNPGLNVVDLMSKGKTINPVEIHLDTTIPRIDRNSTNKPGWVRRNKKYCRPVDSAVEIQLATGSDSVTVSRKIKRRSEEIIISEGATDDIYEERSFTATEGAQSAPSLQLDASKDLSRMIKRISKTKPKQTSYKFDATKSIKRTSSKQRISKRVRKQTKLSSALVALHDLAKDIHKHDRHKLDQTIECFLSHHADISILDGDQLNELHPLAFVAGGLGPNPNILSHGEAMAAVDKDSFEESMNE